jgi:cell division cycle 2-like protein
VAAVVRSTRKLSLRAELLAAARELSAAQTAAAPAPAPSRWGVPVAEPGGSALKRPRSGDGGVGASVAAVGGDRSSSSGGGGGDGGAPPAAPPAAPSAASAAAPAAPPGWSLHNGLLAGCRNVTAYKPIRAIDEGAYGRVFHAQDRETGEDVALKMVKFEVAHTNEGFPVTALREVNALLLLRHPNLVRCREVVVGRGFDKVYLVLDFMPHNVRDYLDKLPRGSLFTQGEVKCLMAQLLAGVAAMHGAWVMHRDLKPANLLISGEGTLVICDFGLARPFGAPLREHTPGVVTLWYRAPEVLLGLPRYGPAVDLWAVGCIFAEFLTREPLFPAKAEAAVLAAHCALLGTPRDAEWPGWRELPLAATLRAGERGGGAVPATPLRAALRLGGVGAAHAGGAQLSEAGLDLLQALLAMNPERRISAEEALRHAWFAEYPPPCDPRLLPAFPSAFQ